MRILILAYTLETYATERLSVHFRNRGHEVYLASPLDCSAFFYSGKSFVHSGSARLPSMDAVLLRGLTYVDNGVPIPRIVETAMAQPFINEGALCFNAPASKLLVTNKLACMQALSGAGISIPRTALSWSSSTLDEVIAAFGTPLVFKLLEGTWGVGVVLCDSIQSARSTFDVFRAHGHPFLIQEYLSTPTLSTLRILVVGDKIIAAVRCTPPSNEFRSNIARGSAAAAIKPSVESQNLALRATRAVGLEIAGVDLIEMDGATYVIEVNSVPGLETIDKLCSIDSSEIIVDHIERRLLPSPRQ
jgi:ribosomal protein S6--L-glutamate ligase